MYQISPSVPPVGVDAVVVTVLVPKAFELLLNKLFDIVPDDKLDAFNEVKFAPETVGRVAGKTPLGRVPDDKLDALNEVKFAPLIAGKGPVKLEALTEVNPDPLIAGNDPVRLDAFKVFNNVPRPAISLTTRGSL